MNPILWWSLCAVLVFVMFSLMVSTWVLWQMFTNFITVMREDEKMTDGEIFQFLMDVLNFKSRRRLDPNHSLKLRK